MMAPTPPAFEYDDLINDKAQIVFRKTTSEKDEESEQKSEDEEDEEEVEGTIESFQSSRIEVGGGNIASPVDRALQAPTYLQLINESVGVQTSLKQLKSVSMQHLEQSRKDKGIQMTLEEPEFDKASSMIKEEPQRFLSHQASSLSSVHGDVLHSSSF